jgi:SAM-dependent methyltransferase
MASLKNKGDEVAERYQDYDPFAWLYAHYWGSEYHRQILAALDRVVLKHLPLGAAILDLCCGDGRLAGALAARHYLVTGVDGSQSMLRFARRNAPSVRFLLGDARRLGELGRFHAAISTFDSLNHILKPADLRAVFRGIHKLLNTAGYFVFDLNREEAYVELWPQTTGMVQPDVVTMNESHYDRRRGVATCRITQFRNRRGGWQRSDFSLSQRHHPQAKVMSALRQVGFTTVASFDASEDLGMTGQIARYRTFYLAQK